MGVMSGSCEQHGDLVLESPPHTMRGAGTSLKHWKRLSIFWLLGGLNVQTVHCNTNTPMATLVRLPRQTASDTYRCTGVLQPEPSCQVSATVHAPAATEMFGRAIVPKHPTG